MAIAKEKLLNMYTWMVRQRQLDERIAKEYAAGNIPGLVHLGVGQEAINIGAIAAIRSDDYFTSTHRGCHGHLIARGEKTERMMAELYAKKTGVMKGKGGSMHFVNFDLGDFGIDSMIGTGTVIAPGMALSAKLRCTDQVTLCFFGEGILNTERFHTGLNLASAWKLPVVFICENNTWSESTSIYDSTNLTNLIDRAVAYNIPGVSIDGNDVLTVYEAVSEAVNRARKGEGPTLLECKTCRQGGHHENDDQAYRSKKDIEDCKKRDPIPRFRKKLISMGLLTEEEADRIRQDAVEEMERAVKFAEESPYPGPEEIFTDVFYVKGATK